MYPWDLPDRRYKPGVFYAAKTTAVDGDVNNGRVSELEVAVSLHDGWHCVLPHREVPPRAEPHQDSPTDWDREVWAANQSAMLRGDAFIVHGHGNGSTMCGEIESRVLTGPLVRPVLIVYNRDGHRLSSAWRGLAADHPQVTLLGYRDSHEHYDGVASWLGENENTIEAVSLARFALDAQYLPLCRALQAAVRGESPQDRVDFAARMGLTADALERHVAVPMLLAAMCFPQFARLNERYPEAMAMSTPLADADSVLDGVEIAAWRRWGRDAGLDAALDALRAEVAERHRAGVYTKPQRLATPDAWRLRYGRAG